MAFFTIHPAAGLSERDYQRALRLGPRAVATRRRGQRELLEAAGFVRIEKTDVTAEYRTTAEDLFLQQEKSSDELRSLQGAAVFEGRQTVLRQALEAIDHGLLKRSLFLAHRL